MGPLLTRQTRARRLEKHRKQIWLREIDRRLKAEYDADGRLPMSARLTGLLDAIDRPERGEAEPGST
jgi:hypothetical protein